MCSCCGVYHSFLPEYTPTCTCSGKYMECIQLGKLQFLNLYTNLQLPLQAPTPQFSLCQLQHLPCTSRACSTFTSKNWVIELLQHLHTCYRSFLESLGLWGCETPSHPLSWFLQVCLPPLIKSVINTLPQLGMGSPEFSSILFAGAPLYYQASLPASTQVSCTSSQVLGSEPFERFHSP